MSKQLIELQEALTTSDDDLLLIRSDNGNDNKVKLSTIKTRILNDFEYLNYGNHSTLLRLDDFHKAIARVEANTVSRIKFLIDAEEVRDASKVSFSFFDITLINDDNLNLVDNLDKCFIVNEYVTDNDTLLKLIDYIAIENIDGVLRLSVKLPKNDASYNYYFKTFINTNPLSSNASQQKLFDLTSDNRIDNIAPIVKLTEPALQILNATRKGFCTLPYRGIADEQTTRLYPGIYYSMTLKENVAITAASGKYIVLDDMESTTQGQQAYIQLDYYTKNKPSPFPHIIEDDSFAYKSLFGLGSGAKKRTDSESAYNSNTSTLFAGGSAPCFYANNTSVDIAYPSNDIRTDIDQAGAGGGLIILTVIGNMRDININANGAEGIKNDEGDIRQFSAGGGAGALAVRCFGATVQGINLEANGGAGGYMQSPATGGYNIIANTGAGGYVHLNCLDSILQSNSYTLKVDEGRSSAGPVDDEYLGDIGVIEKYALQKKDIFFVDDTFIISEILKVLGGWF